MMSPNFGNMSERKPRYNELVHANIPELAGKLVRIKKINWIFYVVKEKPASKEYEVTIDDITFAVPEELTDHEKVNLINLHVLKCYTLDYRSKIRELGILKKLTKKYSNLDFWRSFEPGFKMKSLIWWLGGGAEEISKQYASFNLDFALKIPTIGKEKLGEDVPAAKQMTLKEWLNS